MTQQPRRHPSSYCFHIQPWRSRQYVSPKFGVHLRVYMASQPRRTSLSLQPWEPEISNPNNIWWRVQILKLSYLVFPLCHFLSLTSKYPPHHPIPTPLSLYCFRRQGHLYKIRSLGIWQLTSASSLYSLAHLLHSYFPCDRIPLWLGNACTVHSCTPCQHCKEYSKTQKFGYNASLGTSWFTVCFPDGS
jgi:hypothetical protein